MKQKQQQVQQGFTLIELLVVMAIIGVLSTLLMVNFIGIRQRARDGDRKSNIRQMQAALELYRADQGAYPPGASSAPYWLTSDAGTNPCMGTVEEPIALVGGDVDDESVYMKRIPCDPAGTEGFNGGNYYYYSDGITYQLAACLENESDNSPEKTGTAPVPATSGAGCSTGTFFVVDNP